MKIAILGAAAPENPLFRAFSNLGWEVFAEPEIDGMHGDLFFCGDGKEYLPAMKALIAEIGLRPVFSGKRLPSPHPCGPLSGLCNGIEEMAVSRNPPDGRRTF